MYMLASCVVIALALEQGVARPPASTPVREATALDMSLTTPGPPTGVLARREKEHVVVTWKPIGLAKIVGYEVHRRVGEKPFAMIGRVKEATFTDKEAPKGNVEYAVLARDMYDSKSVLSKAVSPDVKPQ